MRPRGDSNPSDQASPGVSSNELLATIPGLGHRRRVQVILGLTIALGVLASWLVVAGHAGAWYTYQSSIYYLWDDGYTNQTQEAMYIKYSDWQCIGTICGSDLDQIEQYINILNSNYSFSCWVQILFTGSGVVRNGSRTISYSTTPWYHDEYTWGYGWSSSGHNQEQMVGVGRDSSDCSIIGAAYGANIKLTIQRMSSYVWPQVAWQ